jgi:ATP-dependent helicase/nuclease subunit A
VADTQRRLDFESVDPLDARDARARLLAIDPTRNVALEASAGTGKTRVLVDRYVGLLLAGVKPRNILAITFTRKAAAEMRRRILDDLTKRHREKTMTDTLWREIRESAADIAISTIDAFCLALLREFPLEADVDPGFELADETETPRLIAEALDRALRIGRGLAVTRQEVALLFGELGEYRLRDGLARLLDRRLVAADALNGFLRHSPDVTVEKAVFMLLSRLRAGFAAVPGGFEGLVATGPMDDGFELAATDLNALLQAAHVEPDGSTGPAPAPAAIQALLERVRDYFLTQKGEPRKRVDARIADFRSRTEYDRHNAAVVAFGPYLVDALEVYRRDINVVLARAVRQLFAITLEQYRKTLRTHGVLDFSDVLERTLALLSQMEEFSRSRFKLESRYQHVLVDEFQDTSRAQWRLVELLVKSWAEGSGVGSGALAPTIFVVGDRKQSIYGFRDAEVAVLDEAGRYITALRPGAHARMAITRSFRSVAPLLAFSNDLFSLVKKNPDRLDAFRYGDDDRFPLADVTTVANEVIGIAAATSDIEQAEAVADEIARLIADSVVVRDRDSGMHRAARPGDIAILFRTRETHKLYEDALARRRVPYYVYKGLGFFDADEIKDVLALLGFLARPDSQLRAAAFLRSRFIRLSDAGLAALAPGLVAAIRDEQRPTAYGSLDDADRVRLDLVREAVPRWLMAVDREPPAELLDRIIAESAYVAELAGAAFRQARENLKKLRTLVRRIQNRGYATLDRIVEHFAALVAGGDESNAIVDAVDAVNLMTTHAAKGLEFPIVFVVNVSRGSGGGLDAIRIVPSVAGPDGDAGASVAVGDHLSDADKDADAKEIEETKRLLYVAVTRARDRLYLTATLAADGRFVAAKGSLGRVLPPDVCALFPAAMVSTEPALSWTGPTTRHRIAVLRASATPIDVPVRADAQAPVVDDLGALAVRDHSSVVVVPGQPSDPGRSFVTEMEREEPGPVSRVDRLAFSVRRSDGSIVRGIIERLLKYPDGRVEVLEWAANDDADADGGLHVKVEAARALFQGSTVTGRLVAPEQLSGPPGV